MKKPGFFGGIQQRFEKLDRSLREVLLASGFLLLVTAIAVAGYSLIEGWSIMDGFYMTFLTMTTIGFSEVKPLSNVGRFWTVAISLIGVGTVLFIFGRLAEVIFIGRRLFYRQMAKQISSQSDHFIICGFGRIGERVAEHLEYENKAFVIVEKDDGRLPQLERSGYLFIHGDAEDAHTLEAAGIAEARGIALTLPEDRDNAFVTLLARELKPEIYILCRANYNDNIPKMLRAGADKVLSPYATGAVQMAQALLRPRVHHFLEQAYQIESLDLVIEEATVQKGSRIENLTLRESNFRQEFGVIVIAVHDPAHDETVFNPDSTHRMTEGQTLVVMGPLDKVKEIREGCLA